MKKLVALMIVCLFGCNRYYIVYVPVKQQDTSVFGQYKFTPNDFMPTNKMPDSLVKVVYGTHNHTLTDL